VADHNSGARADPLGLRRVLDYLRESEVLVVRKLDRLGRRSAHLIYNHPQNQHVARSPSRLGY
jgi:DNA invertase Pin-like site-specific DNA recombinase